MKPLRFICFYVLTLPFFKFLSRTYFGDEHFIYCLLSLCRELKFLKTCSVRCTVVFWETVLDFINNINSFHFDLWIIVILIEKCTCLMLKMLSAVFCLSLMVSNSKRKN